MQRLRQPTLAPLIGSDKVAAHAAWLQMNALRSELRGLLLLCQTLLHVTFGTNLSSLQLLLQNTATGSLCPTPASLSL